jgi:formylglycine-generating enzyme required for sulfatase activity
MGESRPSGQVNDGAGASPGALTASDADDDFLARGTTVGRYVVLERLGAGAMGVVYAAFDPDLDRRVALKLLRPSQDDRGSGRREARMVREAKAIAKLSHPNVVSIFDVGVHEGRVFLAMEHLAGGTLADWLGAEKRPSAEVLRMFVEIGHGLAAAHDEGLVHRDFKPDNVLLDKQGKPKIVDFGLVRLTKELEESVSSDALPSRASMAAPVAPALPDDLTRTGALTGTPAYMAPEQFLGQDVSAASDQFAYCVALYRAVYGEPPFSGTTVIGLAANVTTGALNAPPPGTKVPPWVRRALEQGLALKPADRFATMSALVRQLDRKPITLKRVATIGGPALVVIAILAVGTAVVGGRMRAKAELDATIMHSREEMRRHDEAATRHRAEAERFHATAIHFFDEGSGLLPGGAQADSWSRGEADWARALEEETASQSEYAKASAALEAALLVDPARLEIRQNLVGAIESRLALAEDFFQRDLASELEQRLKGLKVSIGSSGDQRSLPDTSGESARISFGASALGLKIAIARYVPDAAAAGRVKLDVPQPVDAERGAHVVPGSYLLTFSRDGNHIVRLPLLLRRGQQATLDLEEPRWSAIPDGFVFVHAGQSLVGSNEENLRSVLDNPSMHALAMGSFLIRRFETTFAEYVRWLDTLSPPERERRRPSNRAHPGAIDLRMSDDHTWTLTLQPSANRRYVAKWGEPIRYEGRATRAVQDWRRFPVAGVSFDDAQAYTQWLDRIGQVPGAHVCRDEEWERAARGADGRIYANGWQLLPSEANFDLTYGGTDEGFGPDEVGSHPDSASPFGVEDMEGNAGEINAGSRWKEVTALRGASWYEQRVGQRFDNRFRNAPTFRSLLLGFRVCAPAIQ